MFEEKLIELSEKTKLIVIGPSLLYKKNAWEVHREILESTGELYIFNNSDIDSSIFVIVYIIISIILLLVLTMSYLYTCFSDKPLKL